MIILFCCSFCEALSLLCVPKQRQNLYHRTIPRFQNPFFGFHPLFQACYHPAEDLPVSGTSKRPPKGIEITLFSRCRYAALALSGLIGRETPHV